MMDDYKETMQNYDEIEEDVTDEFCEIFLKLGDSGLILGTADSLKFLYDHFCMVVIQKNKNIQEWTDLFQCFSNTLLEKMQLTCAVYY